MTIKEIIEKVQRSTERVADWKALRDSPDNNMGAAYVDSQLKWEFDSLDRLQLLLAQKARVGTCFAGAEREIFENK